jgi:dolichol-phosphate mannosyltransferase
LGDSKMNKGIVKEGILGVLKLRWMSMFKNYRRNVKNNNPNFESFKTEVAIERKMQ